ncbi:MAG TPA: LysR family transcriptional regulator [Burkholderiales bacterium]|nr:LysR family transcriptional regulator [Burkholderiales bacterium]
MELDLRKLKVFVEVVRQGGFSRAAKAVFSTQPTVSKIVRQLEDDCGVPLLDRTRHRCEPTAAGEIVYRRALGLLAQGEDLRAELDELRGLERGKLRVGFPRAGSSALFAPLFVSFRKRYPGVDVEIVVQDKDLAERLRTGELDLALLAHPIPRDFDAQDVRTEPLVVLLPADHALAGRKALRLEKLTELPFVLFEEGFTLNEVILEACRTRNITPKIAARSSQVDFILELVAAGVGIAFLPRVIAEKHSHPSVRRALLDDARSKWRIALAWRRGGYLSHAAQAWLAHARGAR